MRRVLPFIMMVIAAACSSPSSPTITPGGGPTDPGPVVNNTPPVVGKFTVQGTRSNEPPNFADASEGVPVSVEVTDAESNVNDLKYNWSAPVGTFSGTGRSVTWTAPATVDAPTDVTLTVQVVETYTSQGQTKTNTVSGTTTVSLHDSVKEVGTMSHQFLLDFSDSSVPTATVMRNFQDGCYGTADETSQVTNNRSNFNIIESSVTLLSTTINFGGFCPFRSKRGDGCSRERVYWKSIAKKDVYDDFGGLYKGAGQTDIAGPAIDQLAAMYYKDQKRWRLCDSSFDPDHASFRGLPVLLRQLIPQS